MSVHADSFAQCLAWRHGKGFRRLATYSRLTAGLVLFAPSFSWGSRATGASQAGFSWLKSDWRPPPAEAGGKQNQAGSSRLSERPRPDGPESFSATVVLARAVMRPPGSPLS